MARCTPVFLLLLATGALASPKASSRDVADAKSLLGDWKAADSMLTLRADGTFYAERDDGLSYSGRWTIASGILTLRSPRSRRDVKYDYDSRYPNLIYRHHVLVFTRWFRGDACDDCNGGILGAGNGWP